MRWGWWCSFSLRQDRGSQALQGSGARFLQCVLFTPSRIPHFYWLVLQQQHLPARFRPLLLLLLLLLSPFSAALSF